PRGPALAPPSPDPARPCRDRRDRGPRAAPGERDRGRDGHPGARGARGGALGREPGAAEGDGGGVRVPLRQEQPVAPGTAAQAPSADSRTTREHGRGTTPVSFSPCSMRSSAWEAIWPRRRYCMSTLVSWGEHSAARTSQLSWLTTATSSGTTAPARASASSAPRPIWSLAQISPSNSAPLASRSRTALLPQAPAHAPARTGDPQRAV